MPKNIRICYAKKDQAGFYIWVTVRVTETFLPRSLTSILQIKTRHYGRHNKIYVKAWYSHDNSLGQAVPVAASLADGVMGRCQG